MLTPKLRMGIVKVAIITLAYLLISLFLSLYNQVLITSKLSLGPSPFNSQRISFLINSLIGLTGGVIGGTVLVLVNERLFRRRSFLEAVSITFWSYTFLFVLLAISMAGIAARLRMDAMIASEWLVSIRSQLLDLSVLLYYVFWGAVVLTTLLMLQINDKFGPGILPKFLIGSYYLPKKEFRVFMFLDMKSSTRIAEQIGNLRYFALLQDVFSDITDPVLNARAEIYQYVGDEVVVSWDREEVMGSQIVLDFYRSFVNRLESRADFYREKYGLVPKFKAGVHDGDVIAGEVGKLKKELVYSGDVLNTTARIQGLCNQYDAEVLVSSSTLELMQMSSDGFELIGEIELRGKREAIKLHKMLSPS